MSPRLILLALPLLFAVPFCMAALDAAQMARIHNSVQEFIRIQSVGLPGKVSVSVGAIDVRLSLPDCPVPETFLPPGARLWGNATLGVRCGGSQPWTIYVPVSVKVMSQVLVAANPVPQGRVIELADLVLREADLGQMPSAVITDPKMAVGRIASTGIAAGQPLRQDLLRAPLAVQQGQSVTLRVSGAGFRASAEGKALTNAPEGQVTQVRLPNGQSVSGIARAGGFVEIQ